MSKCLKHTKLNNTLAMSECKDGFWLYDETRGMNLAMRAESETAAFVETIEYYQERLTEIENKYSALKRQVDSFVSQFVNDEGVTE